MSRAAKAKKVVIVAHRWLGVLLCTIFLCWFLSGIVLIYCDYPMVSGADRLSHAPALETSSIRVSPTEALARISSLSQPDNVTLESFASRPVYHFRSGDNQAIVYADIGESLSEFPPALTAQVASAWVQLPAAKAQIAELTEPDQWTVSGEFAPLRPLRKYSWPDGEQVYVSTVTGDVVQYSTRGARLGAWFGPIPHWIYFTPLRKRPLVWSRFVIWASGLGTLGSALGLVLGVWMFSPSRRYGPIGKRSRIPYLGQKRWHMALGLLFGPLACTWAFSGMLSMDPFPQLQGDGFDAPGQRIADALRPSAPPREALRHLPSGFLAKRIEFASFHGQPLYIFGAAANRSLIMFVGSPAAGKIFEQLDTGEILDAVRRAVSPSSVTQARLITSYDAYYIDRRHRLPLPALRIELNDSAHSLYYIDLKSARLIAGYSRSGRWNRWLYHGLHSLDFPWLYSHRPLWDILVLGLLSGGTALCVTSLILAWRVVQRGFL